MSLQHEIAVELRDIERAKRMKSVDCARLTQGEWEAFESYYTNGGRCGPLEESLIDDAIARLGGAA